MAKVSDLSAARLAAYEALLKISNGALSSNTLAESESQLSSVDKALTHELVMGVLRWQLQLDRCIEHYSTRSIRKLDPAVVLALRLGLYQLRFLSRIPHSAAVNESVKLVGRAKLRSAQSFVNAILRRATREPEYDPIAEIENQTERLAVRTSHPEWLVHQWIDAFGEERAGAIAESNNFPSAVSFRVVHAKAVDADILSELENAGGVIQASLLTPGAWSVREATSTLQKLASSGEIYLQDEASQLVPHILGPKAGETILDVCAAPGGKTTLLADLTNDQSMIIACDVSDRRLQTIVRTAQTQKLTGITVMRVNAEQSLPFADGTFDRVLVDAPCTGTGTLRSNPELRWRLQEADIGRLSRIQESILGNAARVLKSGGRLLYSTCSLETEENESVVKRFLEENPNFEPLALDIAKDRQTSTGIARIWPQDNNTDGFFAALMKKRQ